MRQLVLFFAVFSIISLLNGQQLTDQKMNIEYQHNKPPSFKSRIFNSSMKFIRMKASLEKNMVKQKFAAEPEKLPKSLSKKYIIKTTEIDSRIIRTISPKENYSNSTILYFHGGAYVNSISKLHWDFIEVLMKKTNATIIVPAYPLAPNSNCEDIYAFFRKLYTQITANDSSKEILFMGDSAGAGLALGFAQMLRNENKPQPKQIILLSPWLDISMSNPDISEVEEKDNMLGVKWLKMAGQLYADSIEENDYRVSPIYGNFNSLGEISVFIGTHDIFIADSRKFKQLMLEQGIPINYFEYPGMFHVWALFTSLKESKVAIQQIANLVKNN